MRAQEPPSSARRPRPQSNLPDRAASSPANSFARSAALVPASSFPFALELRNDEGWMGTWLSWLIHRSGVSAKR